MFGFCCWFGVFLTLFGGFNGQRPAAISFSARLLTKSHVLLHKGVSETNHLPSGVQVRPPVKPPAPATPPPCLAPRPSQPASRTAAFPPLLACRNLDSPTTGRRERRGARHPFRIQAAAPAPGGTNPPPRGGRGEGKRRPRPSTAPAPGRRPRPPSRASAARSPLIGSGLLGGRGRTFPPRAAMTSWAGEVL